MQENLDLDISNYSINDLINLLSLSKNFTKDEAISKSDKIIKKYKNQNNEKLKNFFEDVKIKLLNNLNSGVREKNIRHITDSGRNIIAREKLGLDETLPLKIGQDNLNQILRQIIKRPIIIDSTYRPFSEFYDNSFITSSNTSTNFSFNLSEPIKNVTSLKITNVNIPDSIKLLDEFYGNNYFFIECQSNPPPFGVYSMDGNVFNKYNYQIGRISLNSGTPKDSISICNQINNKIKQTMPEPIKDNLFCFPSQLDYSVNNKIFFVNSSKLYIKITFWNGDIQKNGVPNVKNYNETLLGSEFSNNLGLKEGNIFQKSNIENNESITLFVSDIISQNCGKFPTSKYNLGYILGFRNIKNENNQNSDINEANRIFKNQDNSLDIILNPNPFLNDIWILTNQENNNSNNGNIFNPIYSYYDLIYGGVNGFQLTNIENDYWLNNNNPNLHLLETNYLQIICNNITSDLKTMNSLVLNNINDLLIMLNNYYAAYKFDTSNEFLNKNIIIGNVDISFLPSGYFYIIIEDFQTGKETSRSIGINSVSSKLDIPSFTSNTNLKYEVAENRTGKINDYINSLKDPKIAVNCGEIPNVDGNGEEIFLPSWPRTLTQNQLYAINQIKANRKNDNLKTTKNAPTFSDILGIYFIKNENKEIGLNYTDESVNIVRKYFGPVTIDRLQVSLYNSNGNLVNLNGLNWSLSLEAEVLYQY